MPTREKPDAIAMLKEDHRKVEDLFEKAEKARDEDRKKVLVQEICTELMIHSMVEEEIFYPACKDQIEDEEVLDEAYVEHDGAKLLINEIEAGGPDDDFYEAKVKVLKEQIEHHVKEEEGELFPAAKKVLSKEELAAIGQEMLAVQSELEDAEPRHDIPDDLARQQPSG